jgi:hypothetical protein
MTGMRYAKTNEDPQPERIKLVTICLLPAMSSKHGAAIAHTVHVARIGSCEPADKRRRYGENGIAESLASAHMKREEARSCAVS